MHKKRQVKCEQSDDGVEVENTCHHPENSKVREQSLCFENGKIYHRQIAIRCVFRVLF